MFSQELIDKTAPGALCIEPMKVWKIPEGKEYKFAEVANSGNYFAELKKDGYWYQFEKTDNKQCYLFSRTVSKTTGILTEKGDNVPHIMEALNILPTGTILIGEIYYPGETSKTVTTIMGCLAPKAIERQKEKGLIHYYVHDIIRYKGEDLISTGAWDRYQTLKELWQEYNLSQYDFLELAEAITENIQEAVSEALARGEEGMVLKKKDCPYSPGKRPAWHNLKIKKVDYLDAICIGFCDATKDYTGKEIESWQYWEVKEPSFYDCFEKDHCFAGWVNPKLVNGNYYHKYIQNRGNTNWYSQLVKDDERYYAPVTKGYFYGWKTAIKIGAYDSNGKLIEIGTVASGLTDELRQDFAVNPNKYLNKTVMLQCMELDKKEHTLRHAFFKGFRDDKDTSECTIGSIFG